MYEIRDILMAIDFTEKFELKSIDTIRDGGTIMLLLNSVDYKIVFNLYIDGRFNSQFKNRYFIGDYPGNGNSIMLDDVRHHKISPALMKLLQSKIQDVDCERKHLVRILSMVTCDDTSAYLIDDGVIIEGVVNDMTFRPLNCDCGFDRQEFKASDIGKTIFFRFSDAAKMV